MPVLFLGHGSPMNVIEDNLYTKSWNLLGNSLPKPRALLLISAHWETHGTYVTAMEEPPTIHDFGAFPQALFDVQYPAQGDPELARRIQSLVSTTRICLDYNWGLDHGSWGLLTRMFPDANIPVLQLSLNRDLSPQAHYQIGQELKSLRDEGVLVIGSGNIVHNLKHFSFNADDAPLEWAVEFDETIKQFLLKGDHQSILEFESLGEIARLAAPTPEHFIPLIYIIAMQEQGERITFPVEGIASQSASMRGVLVGCPSV
ncbi:MAG: 4,5-DOPA dioxygenase extradiol [Candidatus Nitrohelix vancouverensis]|uniref:4,5-DOPA dioxygenase extradiol n=1 Tax=Candidatus Nitrohelix vancouverensis TaxID=2705534 RepID=A0A7T0C5C7_9BACT|nr:MAG: 4,5-DOPA dioxygenase extradiol [Candidatus Nitrohelix vancouverensis]